MPDSFPVLRAVAVDATDARAVAEFYRELLGYVYRSGDEPPPPGEPDPKGEDWLVLRDRTGEARLAVQQVSELPRTTWPDPDVPQQLHLDMTVADSAQLAEQRDRALSLGASILLDRSTDPEEELYVFADPAGHPFCIFVSSDHPG
jgi:catechol 2,3-dioxygenase-like lactoylglutathione lyase family enzyme